MKALLLAFACLALATAPKASLGAEPTPAPANTKTEEVCVLKTNLGTMVFRFYEQEAPLNTAHIKKLVRDGFYDGKSFYRVVKGHVIQAGDKDGSGPTVKGEINSHLHIEGAMGLAHGPDPDSGTSEIYICLAPRPHLDGKFTVFAQIVEGKDVLEKIGDVPVDEHFVGDHVAFHSPKEPVIIEKATIETRPVT
jgi:cyclophilin family peptidyl-prolyl cis-trans isomerase